MKKNIKNPIEVKVHLKKKSVNKEKKCVIMFKNCFNLQSLAEEGGF